MKFANEHELLLQYTFCMQFCTRVIVIC